MIWGMENNWTNWLWMPAMLIYIWIRNWMELYCKLGGGFEKGGTASQMIWMCAPIFPRSFFLHLGRIPEMWSSFIRREGIKKDRLDVNFVSLITPDTVVFKADWIHPILPIADLHKIMTIEKEEDPSGTKFFRTLILAPIRLTKIEWGNQVAHFYSDPHWWRDGSKLSFYIPSHNAQRTLCFHR